MVIANANEKPKVKKISLKYRLSKAVYEAQTFEDWENIAGLTTAYMESVYIVNEKYKDIRVNAVKHMMQIAQAQMKKQWEQFDAIFRYASYGSNEEVVAVFELKNLCKMISDEIHLRDLIKNKKMEFETPLHAEILAIFEKLVQD